jgi:uncharacterized protein YjbI with pentapeptide repeats
VGIVRRVDDIEPRPLLAQSLERGIEVGANQFQIVGAMVHASPLAGDGGPQKERAMDRFERRRMDGAEFNDVSLAGARFENVNLAGASFEDVNLSGVSILNANIKGLTIFGYDVAGWIREQLAKDGCHLD